MADTVRRDITVIGGSAGAVPVLRQLFAELPPDYPAAIFVALHLPPDSPWVLAALLDRRSPVPVTFAEQGGPIRSGTVTIAPPDHHLILQQDYVLLTRGPRENAHRPSIDVLFRSAAVAFGSRVTGVILSGMLDDGAAGLWAVKRRGGAVVVQHVRDAEFPELPRNAIEVTGVDHEVPARDLPGTLVRLAQEPISTGSAQAPPEMAMEIRMQARNDSKISDVETLGSQVPLTCPECGGALWEITEAGPRFRCHVGHAYSLRSLNSQHVMQVEAALWAALRSLEQSQRIAERMAREARHRGNQRSAEYQEEVLRAHNSHAQTLRGLLDEAASPQADVSDTGGDRS